MTARHSSTLLTRVLALSGSDRLLLAEALIVVVAVRAILWLLPPRLTLRLVRHVGDPSPRRLRARRPSVERVVWAVESVSRRVPHATCLTQAIAAQLVLRYHGYASYLCVGVGRGDGGDFRAHAWLEREGKIVIGGAMSSRLARLPVLRSAVAPHGKAEAR